MKKGDLYIVLLVFISLSCNPRSASSPAETLAEPDIVTPVTLTAISNEPMTEYIELNATSTFLQKNYIKAPGSGYITAVNARVGQVVGAGNSLFSIRTRESQSIGNTINLLDTSFRFSGAMNAGSGVGGYISEVDHQTGDYVQEGEQLAVINDTRSLVFILSLPFELRSYLVDKKKVELLLPDGKNIGGTIASVLPMMDSVSQTQQVIIHVTEPSLPANLIAKLRIEKNAGHPTISLPKQAVLADETQSSFWVMKITDSTTAVKVPVTKGIERADRIEILMPVFSAADRFLLTGNFGLPDTAVIKIIRQ